jgi:hypothetical protein
MLKYNTFLLVLFLHWNKIKSFGCSAIAESLISNDALQVFDASFNALASNSSAKVLATMFEHNDTLIHLDFSHNSFKKNQCEILSTRINSYELFS